MRWTEKPSHFRARGRALGLAAAAVLACIGVSPPAGAALYLVDVGGGEESSSTPPVTSSGSAAGGLVNSNSWDGIADAGYLWFQRSFSTGGSAFYSDNNNRVYMRFDDLTITDLGGGGTSVPVSVNLLVDQLALSETGGGNITYRIVLREEGTGGQVESADDIDGPWASPTLNLPVGSPISLRIEIFFFWSVPAPGSAAAQVELEFADTPFGLPAGYRIDSEEARIVDNTFPAPPGPGVPTGSTPMLVGLVLMLVAAGTIIPLRANRSM